MEEEEKLWLETDYFEKFRCKGGSCRYSCCEGWQIGVSMGDYFKLIGMDCSEELHCRLECAFRVPDEPSPERYRVIAPNWFGKCPLHGENGLCMLHAECGEAVLPEVCRVYPRSLRCENGQNQACCSSSCEAVIEILMEEEKLQLQFAHLNLRAEYRETKKMDIQKFGKKGLEIMQDRSKSLGMRVRDVCALLTPDENIPGEENALKMAMDFLSVMAQESRSLEYFGKNAFERYIGCDADANYAEDISAFEKHFPSWQRWMENILLNHMVYETFPCTDERLQPARACAGLCAVYGCLRVVCASWCRNQHAPEDFADAVAGFFRMAEHSPFYYNAHVLLKRPFELLKL